MKSFTAATFPLDGIQLIEASAGTGKTYSITLLVLRLVVEAGCQIDELLVVTFTDAATLELRQKVYGRLQDALAYIEGGADNTRNPEAAVYNDILGRVPAAAAIARLRGALLQFDSASIFTIHGFCQRLLSENAFETGMELGLTLEPQTSDIFDTLARDFWLSYCHNKSPLMVDWYVRQGVTVSSLSQLAQKVYGKPDLQWLTSSPQDDAENRYLVAYARTRTSFDQCTDRLAEVFTNATGINKRRYSKSYVPKWMEEVRLLLQEEVPSQVVPGDHKLLRFGASAILKDAKEGYQIEMMPFFFAVDELVGAAGALRYEVELLRRQFIIEMHETLARRKDTLGVLFFDDLLLQLRSALEGQGGDALVHAVSSRYRAALIDEFQDTDRVQYDIFKRLFIHTQIPFFMIGDPKQAIYGFRGGDIFAYMHAAKQANENVYSLDVNWRSSSELVAAVNLIFGMRPNPFLYDGIGFHPVTPHPGSEGVFGVDGHKTAGFQFLFCPRKSDVNDRGTSTSVTQMAAGEGEHLRRTAEDIAQMLRTPHTIEGKQIEPEDIAVLVRSNQQALDIRDALEKVNVAATTSGEESIFGTMAARELFQILAAIAKPIPSLLKTALSTVAFGVKGDALLALANSPQQQDMWMARFVGIKDAFEQRGIVAMTHYLQALEVQTGDGGLKARVLRQKQSAYAGDFIQLMEVLQQQFSHLRISLDMLFEQYQVWLEKLPQNDSFARRCESMDAGVQVVTVHKSKGLQYPVVYLPFLMNKSAHKADEVLLYHDGTRGDQEVCDLRVPAPDTALLQKEREDESEQMRLLYVALTRAKHVCKVVFGAFRKMEEAPLVKLLFGMDASQTAKMSDEELRQSLELLCEQCGAAVMMPVDSADGGQHLADFAGGRWKEQSTRATGTNDPIEPLRFVPFTYHARLLPRGSSFSNLIQNSGNELAGDRSYAHYLESKNAVDELPRVQQGTSVSNRHDTGDKADFQSQLLGLHPSFEPGPVFGSLIHDIFETTIVGTRQSDELTHCIAQALDKYGLDKKIQVPDLFHWIVALYQTRLNTNGATDGHNALSLGDLKRTRVPELEFVLPVDEATPFSSHRLATAMGIQGEGEYSAYARQLNQLSFSSFYGHLKGFIDLVFEWEGRYYILDYKTNHLGESKSCYGPDALARDMGHHHYYLQYHLYTVALHRYLNARLPAYRYEEHFGGVYYLYVRGMSPAVGPAVGNDTGVFFDRPPLQRIEALDKLFQCPAGGHE